MSSSRLAARPLRSGPQVELGPLAGLRGLFPPAPMGALRRGAERDGHVRCPPHRRRARREHMAFGGLAVRGVRAEGGRLLEREAILPAAIACAGCADGRPTDRELLGSFLDDATDEELRLHQVELNRVMDARLNRGAHAALG